MITLIFFAALAATAVVCSIVTVARDGYRRIPTHP